MQRNRKAFTLIELIVVVAILGILMSVLVVNISGGTEAARAVKCLANLSSLSRAVHQYGASTATSRQFYPLAGSKELMAESLKGGQVKLTFYELPGWVNWLSKSNKGMDGKYREIGTRNAGGGTVVGFAQSSWYVSPYESKKANPKDSKRVWCVQKGALWDYIDHNYDCYVCPNHIRRMKNESVIPVWSYAMNSYFGWTENVKNFGLRNVGRPGAEYGDNNDAGVKADRMLLFAELQWEDWTGEQPNFSTSSGYDNDGILQYGSASKTHGNEIIGFNHKSGRDVVAHVVFVDGHTDKIVLPMRRGKKVQPQLSKGEMQELTTWLCQGKSIRYNGSSHKYEVLK